MTTDDDDDDDDDDPYLYFTGINTSDSKTTEYNK